MYIKSSIICCFLLNVLISNAQVVIKGTVQGGNKKDIYASIRLLRPDSTFVQGTVTDNNGLYCLSDISAGDYLLCVSSMGYIPQWHAISVENQDKTLPLFTLKENSVLLHEVEVNASSFIRQKDRVLIIPEEQQVKHAYTNDSGCIGRYAERSS